MESDPIIQCQNYAVGWKCSPNKTKDWVAHINRHSSLLSVADSSWTRFILDILSVCLRLFASLSHCSLDLRLKMPNNLPEAYRSVLYVLQMSQSTHPYHALLLSYHVSGAQQMFR